MVDFVLPISQKDIHACQLIIDDLKGQRSDEAAAWEQPLASLTKGIELHYQHELLIDVLNSLPNAVTESLFSRLLNSSAFNYSCLKTLIAYINSLSWNAKAHQTALVTILLSSRIIFLNQPEVEKLLLLLDGKSQSILLSHLFHQAKHSIHQPLSKTLYPNPKRLSRTYTSNYKQLLTFLTQHVSQNELTLQTALNDNPILANLVMGQLLDIETDVIRQQELLQNILRKHQLYDWNDHFFIEKIETKLITILSTIPSSEIKEWFQLYLTLLKRQPKAINQPIQFLDKLYSTTNNATIIANCLDAANLSQYRMSFDFLMHSKIKDRFLRQLCLKRINIEQLGLYHQHMLQSGAMGHDPDEDLINDFIHLFCTHINKLLDPQKLLQQLAVIVSSSPINTAQLAVKVAIKHLSSPKLISQWLQVLIAVNRNNALLIPHCISFIKEHSHEAELIVNFLKGLSDKDLLTLYLAMFTQGLDKSYFSCFKKLFKSSEKQGQLFYLLRNTPIIHPDLLNEFVSRLDDNTLLNLIGDLLTHAQPYSEYKTTINQILLIFCQRLYSDPEPTAAINQWQQHPSAKVLVDALLETPECVSHLTTSYSTVYSLVTWANPEDALKHRMDAVLNCYELSPDKIKHVALILLAHFHDHADQINSVFSTLRETQNNRTPVGRKNLSGIIQACWELMAPGMEYKEEEFFTLIQTPRPEYFNATLTQVSQLEYLRQAPYLGSLILAKTRGIPLNIDTETFIALLVHSPTTLSNWKKAAFWLKKLSVEEQLNFIKKLLEYIRCCNNNPILNEQIYRFIVHHSLFGTFLPQLDPAHWYWLIQNIPETRQMEQVSIWLDVLIEKHGPHKLNLGKMLSVLPPNSSLLTVMLQKKTLVVPDIFAQIASQLSGESNGDTALMHIQHYVKKQDKNWKQQFLQAILSPTNKSLHESNINCLLLHILQDVLLGEDTALLSPNSSDKNLVIEYLKLLDTQIKSAEGNKNFAELNQLMISTITILIEKEPSWEPLIGKEDAYWHTVLRLISNFDLKGLSINEHPLIHLLLHCSTTQLAPQLTNNPSWQKILQLILFNPPEKLNARQFIVLFNWLLPESQTQLAQQLLTQAQLSEVHVQSLSLLVDALDPVELFQLIDSHEHPQLIAKGLLTHKEGLDSLSSIQQAQLFAYIHSSEDLIAILNSSLSVDIRSRFAQTLFQIYGQNANRLSRVLEQWLITPEAIAALANFTFEPRDQQTLDEVLQEKSYYRDYLNEYLQTPTLDMEINEHSYLNQATHNKAMYEEDIPKLCSVQAIEQLPPEDIFITIKHQFYLNQKIEALSVFFTPFNGKEPNPLALFHSAQWQQQLLLIHDGLLEVIRVYQDKETTEATKRVIEQTELYKKCLFPLLALPKNTAIEKILSTQLISLLQSYLSEIAIVNETHHQSLQEVLSNHTSQLLTIKFFSLPQLFDFFASAYPTLPFQQEDLNILNNAYDLHTDWLKRFSLEPEFHCTEIITAGLKAATSTKNKEINQWLIQHALFSFLSASIDETYLQQFITSIKPEELSSLIHSFFEQEQACHKAQQLVQNLKLTMPITELIRQLLAMDLATLNQLITVCKSLNLLTLTNLFCFTIRSKELRLTEDQVTTLCLSSLLNESRQNAWLHIELELMEQRVSHVSKRLAQITKLGFSYTSDAYNTERLDYLANTALPSELLINCLNSYQSLFIQPGVDLQPYLKNLDKILNDQQKDQDILPSLNLQLIQYVIDAAIAYPARYAELLEKIIHSPHKELVLEALQAELNRQIEREHRPQPASILELSAEQIESYPPEKLNTILSLQHLIFLNNPIEELRAFAKQSKYQDRERQLFCADASLYVSLLSIEKKGSYPLKKSTLWLTQHAKKSRSAYTATMLNLTSKDKVEYPLAQYYWLCWDSFVAGTTHHDVTPIIEGLLHWLSTLEEGQLNHARELNKLLEHIAEQNILSSVLRKVFERPQTLTPSQTAWLCERSIQIAPQDTSLFPFVINLSSWSWLENYMKKNEPQNFELLKAALGNSAYIKNINLNQTNQQAFISSLEANQFTSQQILTLVEVVHNQQVRTLLIMHLLSRQEYLAGLQGESVLNRLNNGQPYRPSRISALVQQLDISLLSESIIGKLSPETAISILCSIPHFHQLKEEQVALLFKKYPHPTVIAYWMSHYSSMPNAYCALAHFMKIAEPHVSNALNNMDECSRETIINKIIQHLELFAPLPKVLMEQSEERHLILAIRLFLNGHQNPNYANYINKLTERLLNNNHSFSLQAIQLLISLCNQQEFSELSSKTALLTSHYLKAHAQSGEIGLFYDTGKLNVDRMTQPLQLKTANTSQPEKARGFFASLLGAKTTETKKTVPETYFSEHSLITELMERRKPITSFYYFLIHFKGDRSKINKVINDYLCFHTQEIGSSSRRRLVHQIVDLINKSELEPTIREELYASFLRYPDLFDKQISFSLFVFDIKRTIQYFGLKGGEKNYIQVINLCTLALRKLNHKQHEDLIDIATKAQQEAERELSFSQEPGFFTRLFMRLIRCWYYGWTGFFVPNPPTYVAVASDDSTPPVDELASNDEPMLAILSYKPEPDLTELLKELTLPPTPESLEQLVEAINALSLKAKIKNELEMRQKVHELFLKLHEQSKADKMLENWLTQNQPLLTANLSRLLELALARDQQLTVKSLLEQIKEVAPTLQQIADELTCTVPQPQEEPIAVADVPSETETSHLATLEATLEATIETTSGLAYNAYNWARDGFSSLFKPLTPSSTTDSKDASTKVLTMS